jgi:hypothetical protein
LFDLVSRAPLRFVYAKSSTSEHKLIRKLIDSLRKGDLLLMDNGFYYCATFVRILARKAHFIIPAKITLRPQVIRTFATGDYLCRIFDSHTREPLTVRVVFVHRNGFRRRRLVTSLLDPSLYPAEELAQLYHMRWDIETFYRDFKRTMRATSWHCHRCQPIEKRTGQRPELRSRTHRGTVVSSINPVGSSAYPLDSRLDAVCAFMFAP